MQRDAIGRGFSQSLPRLLINSNVFDRDLNQLTIHNNEQSGGMCLLFCSRVERAKSLAQISELGPLVEDLRRSEGSFEISAPFIWDLCRCPKMV